MSTGVTGAAKEAGNTTLGTTLSTMDSRVNLIILTKATNNNVSTDHERDL